MGGCMGRKEEEEEREKEREEKEEERAIWEMRRKGYAWSGGALRWRR